MDSEILVDDPGAKAKTPSIVEHFSIEGLFGYRSISLSSEYAATVLIARNGSGKTTLLAALDAFLRGQFSRFIELEFESISCRLRGHDETLTLHRSDVDWLAEQATSDEIGLRAKAWELQPLSLLELVENGLPSVSYDVMMNNHIFHQIYTKLGYDYQRAISQCERLSEALRGRNAHYDYLRSVINEILGQTEIVYLPTYRRIELSLPEPESRPSDRRRSVLARLGVARSGLYTADIQFGLGDISERLRALYSEMLLQSHRGYGKVSANVINDLISGQYKSEAQAPKDLPARESLELFFSRIKDSNQNGYRATRYPTITNIPNLDRVYNGDVSDDAKPFLSYFLDQLNTVIKQTRGTEDLVQQFIENCNKYLSGEDRSVDQYSSKSPAFIDTKKLEFNRQNLTVKVISMATGDEVPLESLSSGEKQMISLFARLYLYPQQKIILIDEPELSLSLDWQRQILPDILRAQSCVQVISITHSPFIFDNELQPFAGTLKLQISKKSKAPNKELDLF